MTIASFCCVLHWRTYRNVFEKLLLRGMWNVQLRGSIMDSYCLFFWSFLFSLVEKLTVDFLDSKHDEVLMCRSLLDHYAYLLILPWTSQLCPLAAVTFLAIPLNLQCEDSFCPILSSSTSCPLGSDDLLKLALFDSDRKYEDMVVSVVNHLCSQHGLAMPFSSKANGNERKVHLSLGYCIIAPHWSRSHINCTCFIVGWIKREIGTLKIKSRCWRALLAQLV